jgi:hypothetical protein
VTDDHAQRRLTIELEGPPREPTGWVSGQKGRRRFEGWLQLLAALEEAIGASPAPPRRRKRLG